MNKSCMRIFYELIFFRIDKSVQIWCLRITISKLQPNVILHPKEHFCGTRFQTILVNKVQSSNRNYLTKLIKRNLANTKFELIKISTKLWILEIVTVYVRQQKRNVSKNSKNKMDDFGLERGAWKWNDKEQLMKTESFYYSCRNNLKYTPWSLDVLDSSINPGMKEGECDSLDECPVIIKILINSQF